ncbi:MAG: ABC transporter ATP-binding protein [Thermobacillus sp.]|uniref:ABC-type nitrate/sulfonate/bicarbonate transport system, ATPase component n=1 Tax=Thermobacillus composti (strain DSM 18247 / JCM 13945 / KWC4) TaxID=717605 RepID=L0EGI3_THECK|nr:MULTISPECIES: ABC transporter ATP-binding protein [Thermobacillus]AGA58275.1 ABC-type nitrate/sulfonate/bicarbonate transport system, ATPase component [Thermobacillus composti KWC4]REK53919.1 MAG: ABC transporter ATP-binding protein [Thermobacillus sp.]
MPPALEVRDVVKRYGDTEVLAGVSLTVEDGEFVSLIGPSGSGKSTLFRVIGGLEPAQRGEIFIDGRRTNGERGLIAYMPQQASLLPWRTVAGNIELALGIAGVPRGEAKSLTREWLGRVGLADYADAWPHTLSGGMQQRVSFIRALLSPQKLMCLDEPFGALDALTRQHMQEWLLSMWEANRRAVLLVTHSIEEALLLSDRIVVLSARPASVLREFAVPFGRPRGGKLWKTPEFAELRDAIYDLLKPAAAGGPDGA